MGLVGWLARPTSWLAGGLLGRSAAEDELDGGSVTLTYLFDISLCVFVHVCANTVVTFFVSFIC